MIYTKEGQGGVEMSRSMSLNRVVVLKRERPKEHRQWPGGTGESPPSQMGKVIL